MWAGGIQHFQQFFSSSYTFTLCRFIGFSCHLMKLSSPSCQLIYCFCCDQESNQKLPWSVTPQGFVKEKLDLRTCLAIVRENKRKFHGRGFSGTTMADTTIPYQKVGAIKVTKSGQTSGTIFVRDFWK